ncbi:MAG: hypothetical protein J0H15_14430 [Xanthomonadales bacterium]|nr:hypothetical protein [Xanthomonadales bacterium]
MSARRFRFVRKAARAQWYLGSVMHLSMVLLALIYGFLASAPVAWIMSTLVIAFWAWHWWKQQRQEAAFWESRRNLVIWLEEGRLWVHEPGLAAPNSEALDWVDSIDAVVERGRVVRLLVDDRSGNRRVYAGFHDMDAFATAFRRQAPRARFRRVRLGFPMRLKEI